MNLTSRKTMMMKENRIIRAISAMLFQVLSNSILCLFHMMYIMCTNIIRPYSHTRNSTTTLRM